MPRMIYGEINEELSLAGGGVVVARSVEDHIIVYLTFYILGSGDDVSPSSG